MLLCLDVGNSHIFGGVFKNEKLQCSFRHVTYPGVTSDQLGIFLKTVLRENNISDIIDRIAICSVVPSIDYSLVATCKKYFNLDPFFLSAAIDTGIKNYQAGTGADLIAGNLAATTLYPQQHLIVVDLGTATTITAINHQLYFLGGAILAGLKTSMTSLQDNTAKLPPVEILQPQNIVSNQTIASIQSGLYYGHLGAMREIIAQIKTRCFNSEKSLVISTGGFAHLFENEKLFDVIIPNLVLEGLKIAANKHKTL